MKPDTRTNSLRVPCIAALAVMLVPSLCALASEGSKPYAGDLGQAIAVIVIFVLLLLILKRWAWKPIISQLKAREERIENIVKDTDTKNAEAEELSAHYKSRLVRAEDDAEKILIDARAQAEEQRQDILDKAREDAQISISDAKEDIRNAKIEAEKQLQNRTAELVADAAERVLTGKINEQLHQQLLKDSLKEISANQDSTKSNGRA